MPAHRERCPWPGDDPLYVAYHDDEWGVPERDARALFEKLILDGFQAGLAWITILRKREAFRSGFRGFEPEVIARWGEREVTRLVADPGIVRSRAKIEAAIGNARAWLELAEERDPVEYLWSFVGGRMRPNRFTTIGELPAATPESEAMARALKARGFRFVGPTICYAFMQAVGMVNDHVVGCYRHAACARLGRAK